MKKYLGLNYLLLFALILTFQGCMTYSAKEIHGQVVDAETGQPLEGVVVVASWTLEWRVNEGGAGGFVNVLETLTDKDGKYSFPAWGPRLHSPLSYLDNRDPELRYFKSNYYFESLLNRFKGGDDPMTRTSDWDGKVIQLKPFKGDDWAHYLQLFDAAWSSQGMDCLRECPRYVLALDAESKRLEALAPKGVYYVPGRMNPDSFSAENREFLMRYKREFSIGDKDR